MPQRKVQHPQLNGLSLLDQAQPRSLNSTILDYIHQWRVPAFLFCSEGWLNKLLFYISASVHQQLRRGQDYFCRQCVVNGPEVEVTSTDARLLPKKEMRAEPLDRHCEQQYLRSILEAKLGTTHLRTMKC